MRRPTSYVAAALTLALSLDRERDLENGHGDGIKKFIGS
jgi:hypothetical protein